MAFQNFDPPESASAGGTAAARMAALRARFADLEVDGVLVPHEDEYQSEYVPPWSDRLAFLTGFTGSAGRAVVLADSALFATDGRYTLQAADQVDGTLFTIVSTEDAAKAWREAHLAGKCLGIDPMLHTAASLKPYAEAGATLVPLSANPVDPIWNHRPPVARGPARAHPAQYAGRTHEEKLADLRETMKTDALFIAASDSVSWLMNWRGADVSHTPLVLSRAFVPKDGPITIFCEPDILGPLGPLGEGRAIVPPGEMLPHLATLAKGRTVSADPARTPEAILAVLRNAGTLVEAPDPSQRMKAIKNAAEIAGMRDCHHRDGIAVTQFLAWLDTHAVGATEIDIVERLEAFRRAQGATDASFDTIAGSGPNGAIVHYRVDRSTNRTIEANEPVLIDSGAQYPDGTTDITRTIVAGTPSEEFRIHFTLVLKGHIRVAMQRFPVGTMGAELDPLARAALWQAGFDYLHGTGHGVGAALGVHEGPQNISKRGREPLAPGMIVSNEPGVYHTGRYGIRIENLCLVTEPRVPPGGERPSLSFETLTLAPIDTRLVMPSLLSPAETAWLDTYHARVQGALVGDLDPQERAWLTERCRPLAGTA